MCQLRQRLPHRLHLGNAPLQVGDMRLGDAFDVGAGALLVLPQLEQLGNLGHAETEQPGAADEAQGVDFVAAVLPVAGVGAMHGGQQAQRFVMADHLGRHARLAGGLADVERSVVDHGGGHFEVPFQRRSSSAFITTLKLLKAMAAPAITGLSRPKAARGMPTTL